MMNGSVVEMTASRRSSQFDTEISLSPAEVTRRAAFRRTDIAFIKIGLINHYRQSRRRPSSTRPIRVVQVGNPATKARVPSIGSRTHVQPDVVPGLRPYSSPKIASSGRSSSKTLASRVPRPGLPPSRDRNPPVGLLVIDFGQGCDNAEESQSAQHRPWPARRRQHQIEEICSSAALSG